MERPNQMGYGLAAFLVAIVLSFVTANFVCPLLPVVQKNADVAIAVGVGSFLVFWWVAYIGLIQVMARRSKNRSKHD